MRNLLITLGILLMAGTAAAQGASPLDTLAGSAGGDAEKLVKVGDLFVEAERLKEARDAYNSALKARPKYGDAEVGHARIGMAKAVAMAGKVATSKRNRAFNKAKNVCRKITQRNKDSAVGEICSGWFWLSNDRSARALDSFKKALSKGDTVRGKTGIGEALRRQAKYDEAVAAYREALAAGAGYLAHLGLGLSLEDTDDRNGALAALKTAVQTEPASCDARYHYGRVLGEGPEAVSQLETALAIRPGWSDAQIVLGNVQLKNGDKTAAEKAFRAAVEGEGNRGTAYLGLGQALHGLGKPAEAKEALLKAIEQVPNLVDAYLLLSDIEFASGDNEAAKDALDKALSVAPGIVRVYVHSGLIYFRLGRHTKARSFLTQAVAKKGDLSLAHKLLGDIACERRLYDAGRSHYDNALKGDMADVNAAEINKLKSACKPKH